MSVPRGCKCLKCGQRCRNKHSAVTALWPQRLQNSFFAMTGGTAQLPSVLIWGILIVVDNTLSPWVRFKLVFPRSNAVYWGHWYVRHAIENVKWSDNIFIPTTPRPASSLSSVAHFSLGSEDAGNCHANGFAVLLNLIFAGKYRWFIRTFWYVCANNGTNTACLQDLVAAVVPEFDIFGICGIIQHDLLQMPLVNYLTWRYGSGIFMNPPRPSDVDQFIGKMRVRARDCVQCLYLRNWFDYSKLLLAQ